MKIRRRTDLPQRPSLGLGSINGKRESSVSRETVEILNISGKNAN